MMSMLNCSSGLERSDSLPNSDDGVSVAPLDWAASENDPKLEACECPPKLSVAIATSTSVCERGIASGDSVGSRLICMGIWCDVDGPATDEEDAEACVWMPLGPATMEVLEGGCFLWFAMSVEKNEIEMTLVELIFLTIT